MTGPFKKVVQLDHKGRSSHYACFSCRKHFAKPQSRFVIRNSAGKNTNFFRGCDTGAASYLCPDCRQVMTHMGHNFRPPPQDDIESWEIARRLAAEGFRHNGWTGRQYPTKLKDVPAFLEQHRQLSEGEKLLKQWNVE